MAETRLYIIRHGEAEGNLAGRMHGNVDGDITPFGEKQLEALAERCRDLKVDAVYASPLKRAYKTAQAANRYHGLPIICEDGLREIHAGVWEGLKWDEILERYPEEYRFWKQEPEKWQVENGEAMRDAIIRMGGAVEAIAKANEGKNVIIATHAGVLRGFLHAAKAGTLNGLADAQWCDNASISTVLYENGRFTVETLGDNAYLEQAGLSKMKEHRWWRE